MKRGVLLGSVLIGASIVAIGWGTAPALADPGNTNNNGNHYGWYKENGQNYQCTQYSGASVPEPASLVPPWRGLESGDACLEKSNPFLFKTC